MKEKARNILRIILLLLLLLLPIVYAMAVSIDLECSWVRKTVFLATAFTLLILPALFLKARVYFIVEGVFNFFFFPIEIASLYLNRQSVSVAFLQNILQTNLHEATELMHTVWPACIAVIILWAAYFIPAARVPNTFLIPAKARKYIILTAVAIGLLGFGWMVIYQKKVFASKPAKAIVFGALDTMWMKLYKIYPYNLYIETADIIRFRQEQRRLEQQLSSFRFGIREQSQDEKALYVLVIGEAARYDHWQINGYTRNTTPLLAGCANLVSYDSAFSQANLTSYSVPLIITRATADTPETAHKEKSLPEAFQEAGYRSGFFSTQFPTTLTSRVMAACDYAWYNAKSIDMDGNYDIALLDVMRATRSDSLQFFALHSLGCHLRYEQRYPESFAVFRPVLGNSFSYSMISEENKDKLVNAYDNAILYTDYFLSELIGYLDSLDLPAVMLYMSDHGESFWDDERKLSLHGSYQLSEYEYHVPLLVWYSDEYAARHPEKVQALHQNKTTPVSSDVVFYSMLDFAGIEAIVDSTRSICSPQLVPIDSVRVFDGTGAVETLAVH